LVTDYARQRQRLIAEDERLLILAKIAINHADVIERRRFAATITGSGPQRERLIAEDERPLILSEF